MTQQIKAYWASLQPRERAVLSWGTLAVILILFYALFWQPLQRSLNIMNDSVKNMRVDSVWMQQRAQDMTTGGPQRAQGNAKGANQSLMSVVEQTAKRAGVREAIQQIVPNQNNGEVRVVLEGVDFNQWVKWIDDLYRNYGVDITQINAEKDDDKPNIAEIRLTFVRN